MLDVTAPTAAEAKTVNQVLMVVGSLIPATFPTSVADSITYRVPDPSRSLRRVGSKMLCTKLVYNDAMSATKHIRRSVSLPVPIAKQIDRMAKTQRLSDNRVLVELIELGIEARKQKEKAFFELAERFRAASDPEQVKRLGDELGRLVFGE